MGEQRVIRIDPLSACSLRIQALVNGEPLSKATGFVVAKGNRHLLVTNWHVLAGRDPDTDKPLSDTAGIPDTLRIVHHASDELGSFTEIDEPLFHNGNPRWLEHPDGQSIDVVALPLSELVANTTVKYYPIDLALANVDMVPEPAMPVAIIGYPYGLAAEGAWPIWKTGHIASDPDLNYDGRPAFLIDATTRGGMSGSPVVLKLHGGYKTSDNSFIMAGGLSTRFLGVYSGRIHCEAEIGRVWRPHLISEILQSVGF